MDRYEVIKSKKWFNKITGQTASIYGALPYWNESEKENWIIKSVGYTIRDNKNNTIGLGRKPFITLLEANKCLERLTN